MEKGTHLHFTSDVGRIYERNSGQGDSDDGTEEHGQKRIVFE